MTGYSSLLTDSGIEIVRDKERYQNLGEKFSLPTSEVRFIDLNRTGIYLPNEEVRIGFRARFLTHINTFIPRATFFALPVRGKRDTNFKVSNRELIFGEEVFGYTERVELDTCDVSYMRATTKLNLNSRRRGNCGGCEACVHHYKDLYDGTVLKDTKPLETTEEISNFFDDLERKNIDIASLEQIAVVTGLFHGENKVVDHMTKIRNVVVPRGFNGELMYFGCEVNSREALLRLRELGKFELIYAVDNFSKRNKILNRRKSNISLERAKETLTMARSLGLETAYAYIVGIDELTIMQRGAEMFSNCLSRFPIVNIYQVQTEGQIGVMDPFAKSLEYYLHARKIFENVFCNTNFEPRRWENYRPLWYDLFKDKPLKEDSCKDLID